jgi:NTE family protein
MGRVVKLEPSSTDKRASSSATRRTRKSSSAGAAPKRARVQVVPSPSKPDKTALVLGGGGFTGGVYEIGALRALDLLAEDLSVNDFDVYVGTSAGSFIAALCASGVTPEEMMHTLTHERDQPFREIDLGDLLRLNVGELAHRGLLLPGHLLSLGRKLLSQLGEASLMDMIVGLAEALPPGLYSGAGIERYLQRVLEDRGLKDDFDSCKHELYITATDLDTCERVVFGPKGAEKAPISTAVRASSALPMVYAPVRIAGRELIDGGIVSTTNLDVAVEAGAKLVIVINPIVPYRNDFQQQVRTLRGRRAKRISDMGFPKVGYQAFKLLAHRRLHGMAEQWRERYPGVDIVLIEPQESDELMFETSIMNFASRVEIAKHGFESVARQLAEDYDAYREIFARHGIEISPERVHQAIGGIDEDLEREGGGWRGIISSATGMLRRQAAALS